MHLRRLRQIPVAAIDERKNAAAPAIWDFQKQRAVALVSIFGRTAMKSEENSTSPSFRLTALLRSTMRWLCGLATGREKYMRPVMRS